MADGGPALCRDCGWRSEDGRAGERRVDRCPSCASPRLLRPPDLFTLSIAHIDCDAFYASVEKRDRPELRAKPLIVGGGQRGVVTTACYLARTRGVRSAMPMFKALDLCPDAVVVKPDMAKYVAASREIRALFQSLTPLVEPLSLDEAFLDLSGTERLHGMPPAAALAATARRIEDTVGVSVSVGLAGNKFLAKIASDLDKPRGFAVIGRTEGPDFLADKPVSLLWGVGARTAERLAADGFERIADLRAVDDAVLAKAYGAFGLRLARLARGEDARLVEPARESKSVSAETTFGTDIRALEALEARIWPLAERVADRMKAGGLVGDIAHVTVKTARHKRITRRRALPAPTQLADVLFRAATPLLEDAVAAAPERGPGFRLVGVGFSGLRPAEDGVAGASGDLFEDGASRRAQAERAIDAVRARWGRDVIGKGRSFRREKSSGENSDES